MALTSYTADQLYGTGTPIEALDAATTYTFTLSSPVSSGSAYFVVETNRNADGNYATQPSNSLGLYDEFIDLDDNWLITSSYISGIVVPQGGGSYNFTPTANIAESSSFLRSTGGISLTIEGGYEITDALALAYSEDIFNGEGYSLSSVEAESIDNFCKRIKGEDAAYSNFGDDTIYQQSLGFQISPMLGPTLGTKKYNLMRPVGGVNLSQSYFGGCTANYDGITTNGVNGYINSNITLDDFPSLTSSNVCAGNVLRDSSSRWDFGTYGTVGTSQGGVWRRMGTGISSFGRSWSQDNVVGGGGNDDNQGHTLVNLFSTPSAGQNYHNGTLESINSTNLRPTDNSPLEMPFGAVNVNGSIFSQAANTMMFSHIIGGLNSSMITVWNTIVDDFMNDLGKKTW